MIDLSRSVVSAPGADEQASTSSQYDPLPDEMEHISANDLLSVYFRQIAAEPLLTADQEMALARRIERGCHAQQALNIYSRLSEIEVAKFKQLIRDGREAHQHLTRANTRLVVAIAKSYRQCGLPLEDLIQEGNLGLIQAVDRFDYRRGNRFSTYATWWIRQRIRRAVIHKPQAVAPSYHLNEQVRRIRQTEDQLRQTLGRVPTREEVAQQLNMSTETIEETLQLNLQVVELEPLAGEEGELNDFLQDREAPGPEEMVDTQLLFQVVETILDELTTQQAEVIRLRYGLEGRTPHTLEQIGTAMGVTRERIRQVERDALQRLRRVPGVDMLRDFLS